ASALWRASRTAAALRQREGVDHCRTAQGARFRADALPPYAPGRVAVMTWAREWDELDAVDRAVRQGFGGDARELWQVRLEPVSVAGDWFGFVPAVENTDPLRLDEPT